MQFSPIAIFAYDRPDHAISLIKSLSECTGFYDSEIFVFIDGPRPGEDGRFVEEVARLFSETDHPKIHIERRKENAGLKRSLSEGITKVLACRDSVIVLEDDLVVSQEILLFFNQALAKYSSERKVFSICADLPCECSGLKSEAVFLPTGSSWGWATWSDRWDQFTLHDSTQEALLSSKDFRRRFNAYGLRDFVGMLRADREGLISSWYVHWQMTIAAAEGVSLFPPHPMVRNRGLSNGTHGSRFNLLSLLKQPGCKMGKFDFSLPDDVLIDWSFHRKVVRSWQWRLLRWNSVLGMAKRKIRRAMITRIPRKAQDEPRV